MTHNIMALGLSFSRLVNCYLKKYEVLCHFLSLVIYTLSLIMWSDQTLPHISGMLPRPPVQGHLHHNITRSRETDVLNIDISQTQNADLKETLVSYIHDEPDAYITPDILEFSLWKKVCKMHYMQQMLHLLSRGGKSCWGVPCRVNLSQR